MIDELIILNNDGVPLFYYNFLKKIEDSDYQLVGSFLDQLSRFTKASLNKDLNILEWEKFSYFFYREDDPQIELIFKCDNSKIYDLNIIKRPLDMIAKHLFYKFRIKFKDELENFRGEISIFRNFSEDIDNIFKSKR